MEFTAFDIKFDISFVIIKQNIKEIELIIENYSREIDLLNKNKHLSITNEIIKEKEGEMFILASLNSNKIMQNIIVKSGNLEKFQFISKTLKLWAKS